MVHVNADKLDYKFSIKVQDKYWVFNHIVLCTVGAQQIAENFPGTSSATYVVMMTADYSMYRNCTIPQQNIHSPCNHKSYSSIAESSYENV